MRAIGEMGLPRGRCGGCGSWTKSEKLSGARAIYHNSCSEKGKLENRFNKAFSLCLDKKSTKIDLPLTSKNWCSVQGESFTSNKWRAWLFDLHEMFPNISHHLNF